MKEGTVKEETTTNKKMIKPIIAIIVVLCLLTAASVSLILYTDYLRKIIDRKEILELTLTEAIEKATEEEERISSDYATLKIEFEKLNKRLEGIKDQDDLLRRDIELYIDRKFKLVPKVLCKDIALNVVRFSKELDVSPELVIGIIQVESAFNPMAISNKKARGLMQLMPEWAKHFKLKEVDDLHDVDTNIEYGIKVLKIHIDQDGKGNVTTGLYYYVGKDKTYADAVYKAMGKFVSFRYTVDDGKQNGDEEQEEGEKQPQNDPTESNTPPEGSPEQRSQGHP